jgi:hypothetical protein
MKEYRCFWKDMLEAMNFTKYKQRCAVCNGDDVKCPVYTPNYQYIDITNYKDEYLINRILRGELKREK